jgi:hypothetical protein
MIASAAPALLALGVNLAEAVLQPLTLLAVGGVGQPVADFPLSVPQPFATLPVALLFAVARRRPRSRRGVSWGRDVSGCWISRISRCRALPWRRWRRRCRLPAIALQLAVVVADVAGAMSHIERSRLLPAVIGSAAKCAQSTALHPDVPAALLVGTRWRCLCIGRRAQGCQHRRRKHPGNQFHLDLRTALRGRQRRMQPEISRWPVKRASACVGGSA